MRSTSGKNASVTKEYEMSLAPKTLGDLITALRECDDFDVVTIDRLHLSPTDFMSYRGYYDQLALGYTMGARVEAWELLKKAEAALGSTFQGYKGGNYVMDENTPVWISNHGEASRYGIKKLRYKKSWNSLNIRIGKY